MFRRVFRLLRRLFRSMVRVLLSVVNGSRTTRRGQFVADNSSQNKILILWNFPLLFQPHSFINPISSSATFSSLQLPFQHHCFHQSRFHFSNIRFITPASISAIFFSSIPLPFQQHSFHHSCFHFSNILFINPAFISATCFLHSSFHFSKTLFSSLRLPFQQR